MLISNIKFGVFTSLFQILSNRSFLSQNESSFIAISRQVLVFRIERRLSWFYQLRYCAIFVEVDFPLFPAYRLAPDIVPALASPPETWLATVLVVVIVIAVLIIIVVTGLAYRKRAIVSHSVDDVILEFQKAFSDSGTTSLKDLSKLDDKIKTFMVDLRMSKEILKVVSKHIMDLNDRVQVRRCRRSFRL